MIIDLDASHWRTNLDFCDALMIALGSPKWHGQSVDAFLDSMIWGGINAVQPPYKVRIFNTAGLPEDVLETVKLLKFHLADQREYFRNQEGHDVQVEMEIVEDGKETN